MAAINAASATEAPLLLNETAAKAGQSMVHHFGGTESVSHFGDYRVTVLVRQEEGGPCVLNDLKDGEAPPPRKKARSDAAGAAAGDDEKEAILTWSCGRPLTLANAITCPVCDTAVNALPTRHPFVRLASCVLLVDGNGSVLLTRRAPHMRSFPRAWVFPGGGVDAGEILPAAAARELQVSWCAN